MLTVLAFELCNLRLLAATVLILHATPSPASLLFTLTERILEMD